MRGSALGAFLEYATEPVVMTGLVQIASAAVLAVIVLVVIYVRNLGFEREVAVTAVRGFVQVLAAGAVIGILVTAHITWAALVLVAMIGVAGWISYKRGTEIPGALVTSMVSIGFGTGLVILTMTFTGVIKTTMRDLIVIGSMVIANAMQTNSLLLDRLTGQLTQNREEIEALLSVGASPERAVREYVSTSIYASIIPILDAIKSLGIVKIPGLMAGMIIAGANPIYAAEYQFVIMLMLFAGGGLTVVSNSLLVNRRVFTEAKQLDDAVFERMSS